jgi:hypothetical protein
MIMSVECKEKEKKLKEFDFMLSNEISNMTMCNIGYHEIITNDSTPIYQQNARLPQFFDEMIKQEMEKNLRTGIIRESKSPWCSRIVLVKKPDGTLRLCIDYRSLNTITTKDRYPLPRIDDILDSLGKAKYFSTLDASSGYYQIAMRECVIEKAAFSYKNGLYNSYECLSAYAMGRQHSNE